VWVKAFTWKHEGTPSRPVVVNTNKLHDDGTMMSITDEELEEEDDDDDVLFGAGAAEEQINPVTSGDNNYRQQQQPMSSINISCDYRNQSINLTWQVQPESKADRFYVYLLDDTGKTYKEFVVSSFKRGSGGGQQLQYSVGIL
jgi:hypothetical protein